MDTKKSKNECHMIRLKQDCPQVSRSIQPTKSDSCAVRIEQQNAKLRELVEEAYREGVRDGESNQANYECGGGSKDLLFTDSDSYLELKDLEASE
jgi:hypothetical protein